MNAKLFINYRREDTAPYAGRLYDRLTAHFSEDQVFIDIDQIEPGEDFVEAINRKVSTCDIAIVTIGPNWLDATDASGKRRLDDEEDFVRMEIVAALQRKIRVIPVLVGGAQMPRKQDLPEALAPLSRRNAIELSETRFHADVNRLIEAIERSFTVAEEKTELSATPAAPPYLELERSQRDSVAPANDLTTPVKSTQTTPTARPVPSTSSNAALKEPKVWPRKRLIMIGAIGTIVILLALAGFLIWPNRQKAADQTNQSASASLQTPIVPIATPVESTQATPTTSPVSSTSSNAADAVRQYYQEAADQGSPMAQANLGWRYQNGEGVPKDLEKAADLYQKAADRGNAVAQTNLGFLYQNGEGVPKDLDKARELYQKAADQGSAVAQSNLGFLYQNGEGVPKDLDKARELYQKAADQRNAMAQKNLGWLYQNGEGVPKDLDKARELYQKAADQGNAVAQNILGLFYEYGWGVPKDFEKARELLQKAADQGMARAQDNLGRLYEFGGWDVPRDLDKARELYQKAADQGDAAGQYHLAEFYKYGWGVPKDLDKARELLQKAANQGFKPAISELENLSRDQN